MPGQQFDEKVGIWLFAYLHDTTPADTPQALGGIVPSDYRLDVLMAANLDVAAHDLTVTLHSATADTILGIAHLPAYSGSGQMIAVDLIGLFLPPLQQSMRLQGSTTVQVAYHDAITAPGAIYITALGGEV